MERLLLVTLFLIVQCFVIFHLAFNSFLFTDES